MWTTTATDTNGRVVEVMHEIVDTVHSRGDVLDAVRRIAARSSIGELENVIETDLAAPGALSTNTQLPLRYQVFP